MPNWRVGDRAKCVNVGPIRLPLRTGVHLGGQFLTLGAVYQVRGLSIGYGTELLLEVGAEYGPKLARRFVRVEPEAASSSEAVGRTEPDTVPA